MRRAYFLLVLATFLVACSSDDDATPTSTTTTATATATATEAPEATTTPGVEEDALGTQLAWFLGLLGGAELTAEEYEARFDESFRNVVPFDEGFLPTVQSLQAMGPYQVVEQQRRSETGLSALIQAADGTQFVLNLDVGAEDRIVGLVIQPAEIPTLENPPQSFEDAVTQLNEMGATSLLAAEVVGGECQPIHAVGADSPMPLGSVFKLYVLGALADAIAAGDVDWDDEIVITEEIKSIPSGELQLRPAGSTTTVREAAQLMISISDNTATDLLMDLLGRERVEEAQAEYGHTQPELNMPMLTTREFAVLKIGPNAEALREEFLNADETRRREILEEIADVPASSLDALTFTEPVAPDTLEWFASPEDICAAHVRLQERAQEAGLEPIADILSINPGIPTDRWAYVAFKGGSEPGLMAASWLVRGEDSRTFVLTSSVLNTEQPVDEITAALLMAAARDLMGQ